MKKSQKTRKTQKKCRLLIDKISNWKVNFSLFWVISSCKLTKKKRTKRFFFLFFYTFFSRLLIEAITKSSLCDEQSSPFLIPTFLFWFIYICLLEKIRIFKNQLRKNGFFRVSPFSFDSYMNQKRKVGIKNGVDCHSQSQLFVIALMSNREKKV